LQDWQMAGTSQLLMVWCNMSGTSLSMRWTKWLSGCRWIMIQCFWTSEQMRNSLPCFTCQPVWSLIF
jgi:hypothetical protein